MSAPRLEIDLGKIRHNARVLVNLLRGHGIAVSGVTKAMLGLPDVAREFLAAGVSSLADSRLENIQTMRKANIQANITLIRSPMIGQADLTVRNSDVSLNTELDVISALSKAACELGRDHGVLLMVELGDLREGIMPVDLENVVRRTLGFRNITLKGIGTNLACRSGVVPDATNMGELSNLADRIEAIFGPILPIISGGNSSNLGWVLGGGDTGRINHLRLGEAILLGCDPLLRQPIADLYTDAIILVAEVIESKVKPSQPWGMTAESAFGVVAPVTKEGDTNQAILALGHMDTDPEGLTSTPGLKILGSSSDHLIVDTGQDRLPIGAEIAFELNYSALIRAMASPFVAKRIEPGTRELTKSSNYADNLSVVR